MSSMKSDKGMWEKGILSVESFFFLDALGIASETHRPPVSLAWHPVSDGMGLPYPLLFNWQLAMAESPIHQHYQVVHWVGNLEKFGKNIPLWSFAHMKG